VRIVSLLPSATEIVYALGIDHQLVGVTFECNEPAEARRTKTVIVRGRDTSNQSLVEIDAYVRDQLASGGDLYTLQLDALADLDPDLILTQDLCQVCAVPTGKVRDAMTQLGCSADVVTLDPHSLDEVLGSIDTVAAATGVAERGARLVTALRSRLDAVAVTVAGRPRRRVAIIEWIDPVFGAGHWIPDMVEAAGGIPVAGEPRQRSKAITWDDVRAAGPDVVIVSPCGFGLEGAVKQAEVVVSEVPSAEVWGIDGDALIVRPGPRLIEGVETLAAILHRDVARVAPVAACCVARR
jgi:iron complex transport system substrate-binding protein